MQCKIGDAKESNTTQEACVAEKSCIKINADSKVSADAAQREDILHHDIPLRPWEVLGAEVFHFNNKNYLCIVDYHSKFPVIKRMEGLSMESLSATIKIIFAEYGIP